MRLWNVTDPARPALIGAPLTGPSGYVWAVAFSPDGRTLAAGVTDGTVWLWHLTDPAHPAPDRHPHRAAGPRVLGRVLPLRPILAAASNDGTVHLWDTTRPSQGRGLRRRGPAPHPKPSGRPTFPAWLTMHPADQWQPACPTLSGQSCPAPSGSPRTASSGAAL